MVLDSGLNYIITHVTLPPKLPQKDDSDSGKDVVLLQQCEAALRTFQTVRSGRDENKWSSCSGMIRNMLRMRDPCGDMIDKKICLAFKMEIGGMET